MSGMSCGRGGEFHLLTAAEIRVLELLSDDFTNREIADLLVCSPDTVKSHVSHIRTKLDLPNRRDAARLWRQKITRGG